MEKRRLTEKNKYCMVWIAITIAYFLGFYLWFQSLPKGDYAGLAVGLIFLISTPIFSIISGWLVYKGTNRIFLPNIITIFIMGLINLPAIMINAMDIYRTYIHTDYFRSYQELVWSDIKSMLLLGAPILIISVISSAITRSVILRKKAKEEKPISQ